MAGGDNTGKVEKILREKFDFSQEKGRWNKLTCANGS